MPLLRGAWVGLFLQPLSWCSLKTLQFPSVGQVGRPGGGPAQREEEEDLAVPPRPALGP